MPKTLSNSKMGRLVARLFGRESLELSDGKVALSDDEKAKVVESYGQAFLDKLLATQFAGAESESASDLFEEAVRFQTEQNRQEIQSLNAQLKKKDLLIGKLQEDINTLAAEPEPTPAPAPAQTQASKGPAAVGLDLNARHNRLAAAALAGNNPLVFAQMADSGSLNVTDLNAEFQMVMPPKMRLEIISKQLYAGFDDAKHMTRVQSNTDFIASAAIFSEVSQQFTPAWTPKGTATFTPLRIVYRRHKINVALKPAEIIPSWLLYLYEQGKTLAQMPITLYIINVHIMPKILDDITTSMIGKGKFIDAGTKSDGDEAPLAKNSMDGYETILVEGKTDPKCKMNFYKNAKDPYTLTDQELLDYVNGFVDSISSLFANKMDIHCAPELLTRYQRADFAINGRYTGQEIGGKVRFTNFNLVPLASMYRSPILFATPKENFVELVDMASAEKCIQKINEYDYDIHIIGEYSLAVGFKVAEAVYAAVPDGYTPSEAIATGPVSYGDAWQNGTAPTEETEEEETV